MNIFCELGGTSGASQAKKAAKGTQWNHSTNQNTKDRKNNTQLARNKNATNKTKASTNQSQAKKGLLLTPQPIPTNPVGPLYPGAATHCAAAVTQRLKGFLHGLQCLRTFELHINDLSR